MQLRTPLAAVIRGRQRSTNRRGHSMQANLRKVLVAVALITPAPSAFADVIADWNEKAVAFVTPRMTPPAAQRMVAMVQVAMFDAVNSMPLPALPGSTAGAGGGLERSRRRRGCGLRAGRPQSAGAGRTQGCHDCLSIQHSRRRREVGRN